MFRDAETKGLFLLRISGSSKPGIACENCCVDRTVLRIVYIGKRADFLLILKHGYAGEQLGLVSHTKPGNNRLRSSAAKRLADRPFDESIGEDECTVPAEREVDDKLSQPWIVGNFCRPETPAIPGLEPERGDDFICGANVLGRFIQFREESVAKRLECRISQGRSGNR